MGGETPKKTPYQTALAAVLQKLDDSGLPWPAKPKDYGEEYNFPSDPTTLTHQGLAQLRARLIGWHGYAVRLLAVADMSHDLLAQRLDIAVAMKMDEGKLTKAQVYAAEPSLLTAEYSRQERAAYIKGLKAQMGIYKTQATALSREQTRRSDEMKMRMNG